MKRYLLLTFVLIFVVSTPLRADDTDIYQTSSISLEPNVLIIFDTSLSMDTADVTETYYDPSTTYSGSKIKDAVYTKSYHGYTLLLSDYHDISCPAATTYLESQGYSSQNVRYSYGSWICSYYYGSLYLGNWINYDQNYAEQPQTRLAVAKEVIKNVIDNTNGVRFGLMRFNHDQGGYLVAPCGTDKVTLKNAIDNFGASDFTPLAETLAEAGLYFAGKHSWFNGSSGTYSSDCDNNGNNCKQYVSPMTERCQKNYIILMTDGEPTYDQSSKLTSGTYINNDVIGDYDNDNNDPGPSAPGMYSSDYLDDVAKYLYENDLNSTLGTPGESFEKQNISVYTIGFKTEQQLLSETAQNGGGEYYTANSISGLSAAFEEILTNIADVNAVFVSPVVPVSRMNRTFAGNSLYVGFFKPQTDGKWAGNIKKYGIDSLGRIIDANGIEATLSDGTIKDNARSYWSPLADGPDVLSGGVGGLLLNQATRNLYTNIGSVLTAFTTTNPLIQPEALGLTSGDTAGKNSVINYIRGAGRDWIMGDILHSKPSVVHYDTDHNGTLDEAFIFAGSNGGMMHCFKESDGSEAWGYIPEDQLPRLKELSDENQTEHKYFVDGEPVVYEDTSHKILFFGERRGGNSYYALNVTTYNSPSLAYTIGPTFLVGEDGNGDFDADGDDAILGQSWSAPTVHTIKTSSGSDTEKVFLMAGGYDENQDQETPDDADTVGRAVFTVNALTGAISKLNINAGYYSAMTHCIVDVAGFDANGNGITNRVYAGDLAGNMFAFEDDDGDGDWSRRKLFSASAVDSVKRKIFYSPDAVEERYGEQIFFGTGDRANPEGTGVENRIYSVKNEWTGTGFTTLTESELTDVTENLIVLGTEEQQADTRIALESSKGWYIKLDQNAGEKVTSPVLVFNGVAYFTTYTPESGPPPADLCAGVSGRGTARLYALKYKTGEAAFEWSDIGETDAGGNTVDRGRWDRSRVIGTSIASAPVVAILKGGPQIYIGVEGGIQNINPNVTQTLNTFYWRQMNN
jgi:type IV pilus assembly protein PilY1